MPSSKCSAASFSHPSPYPLSPQPLSDFSFRWGTQRSLIRSQRFFVFQPLQNVKNVCLPTEYKASRGRRSGRVEEGPSATTGVKENEDDNSGQPSFSTEQQPLVRGWLFGSQTRRIAVIGIQGHAYKTTRFDLRMITLALLKINK